MLPGSMVAVSHRLVNIRGRHASGLLFANTGLPTLRTRKLPSLDCLPRREAHMHGADVGAMASPAPHPAAMSACFVFTMVFTCRLLMLLRGMHRW